MVYLRFGVSLIYIYIVGISRINLANPVNIHLSQLFTARVKTISASAEIYKL